MDRINSGGRRIFNFGVLIISFCLFSLLFVSCKRDAAEKTGDKDSLEGDLEKYSVTVMKITSEDSGNTVYESVYKAVSDYSKENDIVCDVYEIKGVDPETISNSLFYAAEEAPSLIVCVGVAYGEAIDEIATLYEDVYFLSVETGCLGADNIITVEFSELEAGFIAGYTAVCDGYKDLAYFGTIKDVPYVESVGIGFLQGADFAAKKLGIEDQVSVKYRFMGSLWDDEKALGAARSIFSYGAETVFCADYVTASALIETAKESDGNLIVYNVPEKKDISVDALYIQNGYNKAASDALSLFFHSDEEDREGGTFSKNCFDTVFFGDSFTEDSYNKALDVLDSGKYTPVPWNDGEYPDCGISLEFIIDEED